MACTKTQTVLHQRAVCIIRFLPLVCIAKIHCITERRLRAMTTAALPSHAFAIGKDKRLAFL